MIKRAVVLPDVHLDTNVPKDYLPVKKFIAEYKPDKVIILGDFMNVGSMSAWDYDKKRKMEGRRWIKEVEVANKELDYLEKYVKDKEDGIIYLEGNHEDRVQRYLDKNPEMEGIIEIEEQLGLKKRNVKWVEMNKLYKLGEMHFTHGMYTNKYCAQKHLDVLGCNVCFGHQHKTQTAFQNQAMAKPIMSYALGTLGDKAPDYLKGRPGNWINQFAIYEWDTKSGRFSLTPINVIKNTFIYGGKVYS